jgi:signal transduction histidine kinase
MTPTRVAVIGAGETAAPLIGEGLRLAFPNLETTETSAGKWPASAEHDFDLVVLFEPDDAIAASVTQAVNRAGAPKWAVVILSPGLSDLADSVPPEDWNPRTLARSFRAAVMQNDLLRENLRLRGDLRTVARRISHDLRTPAGCIHTSSDLLAELTAGKGSAVSNIADIFRQSSAEISEIIERVSFLLKASADSPAREPVEIGALVHAARVELEEEIRSAGATIIVPDAWPEVEGLPGALQVVWWNLLGNAVRHAGPRPHVSAGWIKRDQDYEFFVEDRGQGVPASRLAGLFAPFEQLHGMRTPGLGLSIVERLVALQGGRCGYEKRPDSGARFYFTLPA